MWQGKPRVSTALYFIIRILPVAKLIFDVAANFETPQVFFFMLSHVSSAHPMRSMFSKHWHACRLILKQL